MHACMCTCMHAQPWQLSLSPASVPPAWILEPSKRRALPSLNILSPMQGPLPMRHRQIPVPQDVPLELIIHVAHLILEVHVTCTCFDIHACTWYWSHVVVRNTVPTSDLLTLLVWELKPVNETMGHLPTRILNYSCYYSLLLNSPPSSPPPLYKFVECIINILSHKHVCTCMHTHSLDNSLSVSPQPHWLGS